MFGAVERGSAKGIADALAGTSLHIGGKTGSGPFGVTPSDGWFAGIVDDAGRPRFTFAVFVARAGRGGGVAADCSRARARVALIATAGAGLIDWADVRVVIVIVVALGCGRIGFEARTSDAVSGDGAAGAHDALGDGTGFDAAVCAYAPMCGSGIGPRSTCCTGDDITCVLDPATCAGTVTACDVTTNAGCGSGAACCIVAPSNVPACYGPLPPLPC